MLLFVLALGAAACGGGDDNKSTNASDSDSTNTTEAASSAGGTGAYCGLAAKYQGLEKLNPSGDINSIRASLEAARDALDRAVDVAPTEIKADVRVIADAYRPFIAALVKVNFDFTKINPSDPGFVGIQKPEVAAAAQRIAAWSSAHCGANAG
jgi:hypothetical protein